MHVIKRNGEREGVSFDKITKRLVRLHNQDPPLSNEVDPALVAQKVIQGIFSGVTTTQLDTLAAETAAGMVTTHPDYGIFASRIEISNWQKETPKTFAEAMKALYENVDPVTGARAPLVSEELFKIAQSKADKIESVIDYRRDFNFDFFGFRTMQYGYLFKVNGKPIERPQHMMMRVALQIHLDDMQAVFETYNWTSKKYFTHATPTLFNAGTPTPQMSSCFLVTMKDDSIEGIYETLKQTALISKSAGGIGLSVHNIRASNSYIKGTNGRSNGLVPMLRVFNDTARYVDQGGGKRKGAFAIYLEPWHADIFEFIELKKPHGKEEGRARDLFYALWIPDLFMKRVQENGDWCLFCPNEAPLLSDTWGDNFETLYNRYERDQKLVRRRIKAQDLWFAILESQVETGGPYMLFKDACNRKSNQQNLGTIKCSNLCTEIVQFSSAEEVAVCNLASVALPKFVVKAPAVLPSSSLHLAFDSKVDGLSSNKVFDHGLLHQVVQHMVDNMNKVIYRNYYPLPETKRSNFRNLPIGLGVQGLSDVFFKLKLPYTSKEAKKLNTEIFETIYHAALTASVALARKYGAYETFPGSPASKGILQFDMWGIKPSDRWDWASLKQQIVEHGLRNSLLIAPMPTASTSQILGNTESFEPMTSNIYTRRVLSGEFVIINKHLVRDLTRLGLWTSEMKDQIVKNKGSVQPIKGIPAVLKAIYRTVWEMSMRDLMDMAADRGAFIDQSQSFNCFVAKPTIARLSSMHFYGWKKGLKTGMYYLRTLPAADPIAITTVATATARTIAPVIPDPELQPHLHIALVNDALPVDSPEVCTRDKDGCLVCGS